MQKKQDKLISNNKSVYHNYFVEDVIEAGIVLTGTEIKSIRLGKVSINDAYCDFKNIFYKIIMIYTFIVRY